MVNMVNVEWLLKVREALSECRDSFSYLIRSVEMEIQKETIFVVTISDEQVVRHRVAVIARTKEEACQRVVDNMGELDIDPDIKSYEMSAFDDFLSGLNKGVYQFF